MSREAGRLFSETRGRGERVVLLHGFTQNRHCFGTLPGVLAAEHEVVCVDAPGHGGSTEVQVNLQDGASYLANTTGVAIYLGYSLGGRLCLHLALQRPDLVRALVLVSVTPGIEDDAERDARRESDEALARQLETQGLEPFLEAWLGKPLFAGLSEGARLRAERLSNDARGLASSLRLAGQGAQASLWSKLDQLTMPVLLVTGALDEKFCAIAGRMAQIIPRATHLVIPGVGHAAHLEAPPSFNQELLTWLAK